MSKIAAESDLETARADLVSLPVDHRVAEGMSAFTAALVRVPGPPSISNSPTQFGASTNR